jgi:hypothetical protein
LALQLAVGAGTITIETLAELLAESLIGLDSETKTSVQLSLAEIESEFWPSRSTVVRFRQSLTRIEHSNSNRWRLDPTLRALPSDLIKAATRVERPVVLEWLEGRRTARDPNWAAAWTTYLMIERALANGEGAAKFVDLGYQWLDTPAPRLTYEVWHPLVDVHAEAKDSTRLQRLIRMPLAPDAEERFGPRLSAALHVVADVLNQRRVELSDTERDQLRARAAARESMSPDVRLGWWAIELALASSSG